MFNLFHLSLQNFDPNTLISLGAVMHVEAVIEYLKKNWRLPAQAAPFAATVISFGVALLTVQIFHMPVTETLIMTVFGTAGACFWHELSTPVK